MIFYQECLTKQLSGQQNQQISKPAKWKDCIPRKPYKVLHVKLAFLIVTDNSVSSAEPIKCCDLRASVLKQLIRNAWST